MTEDVWAATASRTCGFENLIPRFGCKVRCGVRCCRRRQRILWWREKSCSARQPERSARTARGGSVRQRGEDQVGLMGGKQNVTRHTLHVTRHKSQVTRHTSHVTRHASYVTRHTSRVIRHTSHVTRQASHVTRVITRHTTHVARHTSRVTRHASPITLHPLPDFA